MTTHATPRRRTPFLTWLGRIFTVLVGGHVDGVRAILGLPLLFALLIGWEFAQHVVEVQTGFYESKEAQRAAAEDPLRMAFGWVKMILVYVGGFFVIRWLWRRGGDGVGGGAVAPVGRAFVRYLPYVLYMLAVFVVVFYAPRLVAKDLVFPLRATAGLGQVFIEPLLMAWIVAAATDGSVKSPVGSAKLMGWLYFWALVIFFIGRLPVNAAHQLLSQYALGKTDAVLWGVLALDAAVVGLIIAVIPALYVRIVRHVRAERGIAAAG